MALNIDFQNFLKIDIKYSITFFNSIYRYDHKIIIYLYLKEN